MNELKNKASNIKEKKLIPQEEVYHGALEDILLGMSVMEKLLLFSQVLFTKDRKMSGSHLSERILAR